MIEDMKKGLIGPSPEDLNPKRHQLLGLSEVVANAINFNEPIGLPIPPDEDQGSSSSCTWQAFCYYFYQWTGIQLSRQDGYSRTVQPGGGGYLVDPFRMLMKGTGQGCFDRSQHADPNPQTEYNMTLVVNLPGEVRKVFNLHFWYVPYNDINAIATTMKNFKGIVFGVYGNNQAWQNMEHPNPVLPGQAAWAHALYGNEIGVDRGQDAIITKSSWCNYVKRHFIIKDYFAGGVFSPIAMEVKEVTDMDQVLFVNIKGAAGLLKVSDGRQLVGELAANPDELKVLQKIYGREVIHADGTWEPYDINYGV